MLEQQKRLAALQKSLSTQCIAGFGDTPAETRIHMPFTQIRDDHLFLSFHDNSRALLMKYRTKLYLCEELYAWAHDNNGYFELAEHGARFVEYPA